MPVHLYTKQINISSTDNQISNKTTSYNKVSNQVT